MCGILFHLTQDKARHDEHLSRISHHDKLIQARGPDYFDKLDKTVQTGNGFEIYLIFTSSVLSLRGNDIITGQPLLAPESRSVLMWNGEAWKQTPQHQGDSDRDSKDDVIKENDTRLMLLQFSQACAGATKTTTQSRANAILTVLERIYGPYAFIFYHNPSRTLFYGRDPLGRRSLVRNKTGNGDLCISSVPDPDSSDAWEEVGMEGIYAIDFDEVIPGVAPRVVLTPWTSNHIFQPVLNRDTSCPSPDCIVPLWAVDDLKTRLDQALSLRTIDTAPWVSLPSIEPRVLQNQYAVLFSGGIDCTLLAYILDRVLPPNHTIDLLNVAFENPRVVDNAKKEARRSTPGLEPDWPPNFAYDICPDRQTGLSSYTELLKLHPHRKWRFVSINIPTSERLAHQNHIKTLIRPHTSEMDLSIATALYFAARGQGTSTTSHEEQEYTTQAKVLFSGLGADELFGGYTRHRIKFQREGYAGLLDELDLDFTRIGQRNLGRDDRVISSTGREVRYPFLDEDLVMWALSLPVWEKVGFSLDTESLDGLGAEKLILRRLARNLGLENAAQQAKRAIQFGSRVAKTVSGRTKGTDVV